MSAYLNFDEPYLHADGLISTVVEVAHARGANIQKLLRGTGIFESDLYDESRRFSLSQLTRLLGQFQKLVKSDDAGLLLGSQLLNSRDEKTQLMLASPTIGHALKHLSQYEEQLLPLMSFRAHIHKHTFYVFLAPNVLVCDKLSQLLMQICASALTTLFKRISNRHVRCHFSFAMKRPSNMYDFERNLGTELQFETLCHCWSFSSNVLTHANCDFNLIRYRRLVQQQQPLAHQSFIKAVSRQLYLQPQMTQQVAAQHFAMSLATFKRKLKTFGLSYSQLQTQQQTQRAFYLLAIRAQGNEQVAKTLDFYDTTNFRRAFKRWTGMTPSEMKLMWR